MFENCGNSRIDRRGFMRSGLTAAGLATGALLGASAVLAGPFRRNNYLPSSDMAPPIPTPPPSAPRPTTLVFEVGSGVNPQLMTRCVQDFLAATMSPEYAAGTGQLAPVPRTPGSFHMQFRSDYVIQNALPPTRSRFGYHLSIDEIIRTDGYSTIRPYQDLNFYEMRRLMNPAEMAQFNGMILHPNSPRQAPTAADQEAYMHVARRLYGIANPEQYGVLYTRLYTDGRANFMSFLVAPRTADALRSPFKDLLIDSQPV